MRRLNLGFTLWQHRPATFAQNLHMHTLSRSTFIGLCLCLAATFAFAQNGKISGKVSAKKTGETLIGVTVVLDGTGNGAVTDVDGNFIIEDVAPSPSGYSLKLSYIGYNPAQVTDVAVVKDSTTVVNVLMEAEDAKLLTGVTISSYRDRQSNNELQFLQKNSITVLDGISAESIRRSPDRNTGDVLRRVSGASIQGGRYVIVRGLSDRYNLATVNGVQLPSTEPDRKAFGFDVFPSNLLDNLTIVKTATPDLPGEFAGGIIQIKTRDIPEENSFTVSATVGGNSQSTFKRYLGTNNGKYAWLGLDDGTRSLPKGFPGVYDFKAIQQNRDSAVLFSRQFKNTWAVNEKASSPVSLNLQASLSHKYKLFHRDFGVLGALTYQQSFKLTRVERGDFDAPQANADSLNKPNRNFQYFDNNYVRTNVSGALVNLSYKLNENNKFTLKGFHNIASDNQTIERAGQDYSLGADVRNQASFLTINQLSSLQLNGQHFLPKSSIRIDYAEAMA